MPDFAGDNRFMRRSQAEGGSTMMERGTSEMKSNRLRRSTIADEKRSQSLYSSVKVNKGGFTKMS